MNISLNLLEFDAHHIYFLPSIDNTVIKDSKFIRILYSTSFITLNNVCINIPINLSNISNNYYYFNPFENVDVINKIINIEYKILERYASNKTKVFSIKETLEKNNIKIVSNRDEIKFFLLKVSGIWETDDSFGIAFKFLQMLPVGREIHDNNIHNTSKHHI